MGYDTYSNAQILAALNERIKRVNVTASGGSVFLGVVNYYGCLIVKKDTAERQSGFLCMAVRMGRKRMGD